MRLLICMWWCRCGVDDGFGIMVVSGCSTYVTEPVDMVLVVTGGVLYVVGWAAAYDSVDDIACVYHSGRSRCVHV